MVKRSLSIRFSARKKLLGGDFIPCRTARFSRLTWPLSYYLYRPCSADCRCAVDYYLRPADRGDTRLVFAKGKSRRNRKEEKIRPCIPSISAYRAGLSSRFYVVSPCTRWVETGGEREEAILLSRKFSPWQICECLSPL